MNVKETTIYNNLVDTLFNLEMEGTEIREDIVYFNLENILENQSLLKDPEIRERLAVLVNSNNIAVKALERIAIATEQGFEEKDYSNLEFNYSNALIIRNLYINYDIYLVLLINYRFYKIKNYHDKYLMENNQNSKLVKRKITEANKILIKNLNLKI